MKVKISLLIFICLIACSVLVYVSFFRIPKERVKVDALAAQELAFTHYAKLLGSIDRTVVDNIKVSLKKRNNRIVYYIKFNYHMAGMEEQLPYFVVDCYVDAENGEVKDMNRKKLG